MAETIDHFPLDMTQATAVLDSRNYCGCVLCQDHLGSAKVDLCWQHRVGPALVEECQRLIEAWDGWNGIRYPHSGLPYPSTRPVKDCIESIRIGIRMHEEAEGKQRKGLEMIGE